MPLTPNSTINIIAPSLVSLARMSVSSTGTGTITLNAAIPGFLTFDQAGCSTSVMGHRLVYAINDSVNAEIGSGTYYSSALKITRGSSAVDLVSTNSNSPIDMSTVAQVFVCPSAGYYNQLQGRNRLINGTFRVDQRNAGAAQTIVAAATAAYTVDRWYASCTGANVTGQQASGIGGQPKSYQFTGAASVTAITFGQRVESKNCLDLISKPMTFSVTMSNSVLTSVTWAAYNATVADTWAARTLIATGTFTVSPTATAYQATFNAGANAANGLNIELSVGAQTSGTWTISGAQLELGSSVTPLEIPLYDKEFAACQRYYWVPPTTGGSTVPLEYVGDVTSGNNYTAQTFFAVTMRTAPTVTITNLGQSRFNSTDNTLNVNTDRIHEQRTAVLSGFGFFRSSYTADAEL